MFLVHEVSSFELYLLFARLNSLVLVIVLLEPSLSLSNTNPSPSYPSCLSCLSLATCKWGSCCEWKTINGSVQFQNCFMTVEHQCFPEGVGWNAFDFSWWSPMAQYDSWYEPLNVLQRRTLRDSEIMITCPSIIRKWLWSSQIMTFHRHMVHHCRKRLWTIWIECKVNQTNQV